MYNLMLVDDELEIVESLYGVLSRTFSESFNIITTSYSAAAMDRLKDGKTDILVTDIKMPKYTGFDLAEEARRVNPYVKIVFLTGYADFDYAYSALKSRCDDYILKINIKKEIIESLNRLLENLEYTEKIKTLENAREIQVVGNAEKKQVAEADIKALIVDVDTDAVTHLKQYVSEHINDDLSLQKLSSVVYLTPSYLSRIFKQTTGVTLSEYIMDARITEAKKLLRGTQLKVYEIAKLVGIDTNEYFNRIFKKKTGVSPNSFRKMHYDK